MAENLCEQGYDAVSLKGGYIAWLMAEIKKQEADEICDSVEKSLRKKFHKNIFSKFAKAINQYELVKEGDRIAVCISGGKDSMLMAKLFQELKKHNKFPFEVKFLVMDPGYSPENRQVKNTDSDFRVRHFRCGIHYREIPVLSLCPHAPRTSLHLREAAGL